MPLLLAPLGALFTNIVLFFTSLFSKILIVGIGLAIAKVLGFLGLGIVTYTGSVFAIEYFTDIIHQNFSLIPIQYRDLIFAAFTDLRLNSAISLIFTAYSIRLSIITMTKLKFGNTASTGG